MIGLGWTHKQMFKVKSICTNQERRWLMELGIKMVHNSHGQPNSQDTPQLITHMWEEFTTLFPIIYFLISYGGRIKTSKSPRNQGSFENS
jgi:hypothetical protein